jgi:hypothetical protein
MRQFETQSDFLSAAAQEWEQQGQSQPLVHALVDGLSQAESEIRADGEVHEAGLDLKLGGWVLRTQDMPVIEAIGVVGAAAAAVVVPGAVVAAAVITAVSSFASLCWKAWRRGASLSRSEIAVLGFLQIQGPMTEAELLAKAGREFPDLTPAEVSMSLLSLGDVELRDGSIIELVRRDASGRFRARM